MPTRPAMVEMVANQMMKGPRHGRLPGTKRQRQYFKKRHERQISWVLERLPRCSAAVGAVMVKCLLKYGEEPVARFCKALRDHHFNGPNDPAFMLWRYLQAHRGKETTEVYQKTVVAAKAYMEGTPITSLRMTNEDIFDWDEGFSVPLAYLKTESELVG